MPYDGPNTVGPSELDCHLQTSFERQRLGGEPIAWIIDEVEQIAVARWAVLGVIDDDDGAAAKVGCDQLDRGTGHDRPDIDQGEIDGLIDVLKGFAEVALPEVDVSVEVGGGEVFARTGGLGGFVFGADDHAGLSVFGGDQVDRLGEIEGGDAVRSAHFYRAFRAEGEAEAVAEQCLVVVESDEFVGEEARGVVVDRAWIERFAAFGAGGEMVTDIDDLVGASLLQFGDQPIEVRVSQFAVCHGDNLSCWKSLRGTAAVFGRAAVPLSFGATGPSLRPRRVNVNDV